MGQPDPRIGLLGTPYKIIIRHPSSKHDSYDAEMLSEVWLNDYHTPQLLID